MKDDEIGILKGNENAYKRIIDQLAKQIMDKSNTTEDFRSMVQASVSMLPENAKLFVENMEILEISFDTKSKKDSKALAKKDRQIQRRDNVIATLQNEKKNDTDRVKEKRRAIRDLRLFGISNLQNTQNSNSTANNGTNLRGLGIYETRSVTRSVIKKGDKMQLDK